ncbi:MAG: hypothetical protein RIT24_2634 [Planctomycetota bacterium]
MDVWRTGVRWSRALRGAGFAVAVLVLPVGVMWGSAACSDRTVRSNSVLGAGAQPLRPRLVDRSPVSGATTGREGDADAAALSTDMSRSIASWRCPLGDPAIQPPPSAELGMQLDRAAKLLADGDVVEARALALRAAGEAPANVEPLEVVLVCCLRQEDARGFDEVVQRIARIDPASPFVLAHGGLRAASSGDWSACVASLSWLVGEGALPRRGRMAPLFTSAGEIEEQAGFAALRLGRWKAAEECLSAAIAVSESPRRRRVLAMLRSDALRALGRSREARAALPASVAATSPVDPIAVLEALRIDQLELEDGRAGEVLLHAVDALLAAPDNDVWLWRVLHDAEFADGFDRNRAMVRLEERRGGLGALRTALVGAALDPGRRTQALDDAWLDVRDLGAPVDRVALGLSLRQIARHARQRLVPLACFLAEWRPNDLDAVSYALLGSGAGPDELMAALDARSDASAAALRARILARFGFVEEAQQAVESARGARATSKVLRVAAALSAVDLLDATLLGEVDAVARRDDGSTDRTMALAWYALQEMPIARERAAAAIAFDGRDRSARLCLALASVELPDSRGAAAETVRSISADADPIGGEAWSMRAEVVASLPEQERRSIADRWPACADSLVALRALASECEGLRMPLAAECLGLVEQIDPMQRALLAFARLGVAQRPPAGESWMAGLAAEAPALPDRRQLARLGPPDVGAEMPIAPASARFDWMLRAERGHVRAYRATMVARRPDGPEKESLLLLDDVDKRQAEDALVRAKALAQASGGRMPALAARRTMAALEALSALDGDHDAELSRIVEELVRRMDRLSPADVGQAMRLFMTSEPAPDAIEVFAGELAKRSRPILLSEWRGCIEALGTIARAVDDPFAAGALARAMSLDARTAVEVRQRLATAAVGLSIGAGADALNTSELVRELAERGVPPFEDPERSADPKNDVRLARALQRAAELFDLLGRADEAKTLLRAALELAPTDAELLNGLAYADLERGEVGDFTARMAEQAAAGKPDDPAILDTLGFLRYQQGRFADDRAGTGAVSLFRQALRLRPNSPSLATLDHLGDALWRSGDQQGAIRSWQQVGVVARRRYPPELFRARMSSFQLERFGFELVPVAQFVRREYGAIVERAERKLEQVARGDPPDVADCSATR